MKRHQAGLWLRFFLLLPVFLILLFITVHVRVPVYAQDNNISSGEDPSAEADASFEDEILFSENIMMPETLLQRIQAQKKDYILYDLRETTLYKKGHVIGALQCTWNTGNFKRKSEEFPLDQDIIVISGNGSNGIQAVKFLLDRGFTRIYSIEGGMENWLYREYLEH